ncbi:hypothetical protein J6590_080947 [Homalodisca vitripennis]|nr:hypothetical protein J6590_080947 [Homalodisca vitripennis]
MGVSPFATPLPVCAEELLEELIPLVPYRGQDILRARLRPGRPSSIPDFTFLWTLRVCNIDSTRSDIPFRSSDSTSTGCEGFSRAVNWSSGLLPVNLKVAGCGEMV